MVAPTQAYLDTFIDPDESLADGMTLAELKEDWCAQSNDSPEARSMGISIATEDSELFRTTGDLPDGRVHLPGNGRTRRGPRRRPVR